MPEKWLLTSPVLACSICLADPGRPKAKAAATVIRGYAVCEEHAGLVGLTDDILSRMQSHQKAQEREQEIKRKTTT